MIALLLTAALAAELAIPVDAPVASPDFAIHLTALGDLEGAVREHRRVAFLGGPHGARSAWQAGELLLRLGEPGEAAAQWAHAEGSFPEHAASWQLGQGLAHYRAGSWALAALAFGALEGPAAAVGLSLSLAADGQDEAALAALPTATDAEWMATVDGLRADLLAPAPPRRSPAAAGVMSAVVPGLGQLYVGRPGEALSALLVTGLLTTGTVLFAVDRRWAGTVICGVFASSFWIANVVSAVNGARRFNIDARVRRRERRSEAYSPRVRLAPGPELVLEVQPGG